MLTVCLTGGKPLPVITSVRTARLNRPDLLTVEVDATDAQVWAGVDLECLEVVAAETKNGPPVFIGELLEPPAPDVFNPCITLTFADKSQGLADEVAPTFSQASAPVTVAIRQIIAAAGAPFLVEGTGPDVAIDIDPTKCVTALEAIDELAAVAGVDWSLEYGGTCKEPTCKFVVSAPGIKPESVELATSGRRPVVCEPIRPTPWRGFGSVCVEGGDGLIGRASNGENCGRLYRTSSRLATTQAGLDLLARRLLDTRADAAQCAFRLDLEACEELGVDIGLGTWVDLNLEPRGDFHVAAQTVTDKRVAQIVTRCASDGSRTVDVWAGGSAPSSQFETYQALHRGAL